jgi:hypothetical protein
MSQNFPIPEDDTPDLPPMGPPMSGVAQHLSPEIMTDSDKFIPNLLAGDIFLRYISGGVNAVKGQTGFTGVIIGCEPSVSEYEPGESGRYVDTYAKRPGTARFTHEGRPGWYLPNGNRLVETIAAYMLTEGGLIALRFRSTALETIKKAYDCADRIRTDIVLDGESLRGCVAGKWTVTTRLEKKGDRRWYKLVMTLLGIAGEPAGPSLDQVRIARVARKAFKREGVRGLETTPPAIEAPRTSPPIEGPTEEPPRDIRRGGTIFTSGPQKSLEPPVSPPSPPAYDERNPPKVGAILPVDEIDDDIPF